MGTDVFKRTEDGENFENSTALNYDGTILAVGATRFSVRYARVYKYNHHFPP